jgi:catechol-2,3-dioxygenase
MAQHEPEQQLETEHRQGALPDQDLEPIHHVALAVGNIQEAVDWYTERFKCRVAYQDDTWAMLVFANIRVALLAEDRHPPHLGLMRSDAAKFGPLHPHRDGTWSVYICDPAGNSVEILTDRVTG